MAMTTQELRAHLRTLPADQAEEIRVARKRVARRAYRDRHLRREASSGRLVSAELAGLQEDPEQLALFHERDAERKRRESGAARERVASVRWSSSTPMTTPSGVRSMTSRQKTPQTQRLPMLTKVGSISGARTTANREVVSHFVS
jgi:hypothetical protein